MNTTTTKGFTLSLRGSSLPSRKGFTLIELLVVVAIIGILAGIIITSLSNAREKARDARRDADIKTIQTALEIYYLDHGEYPSVPSVASGHLRSNWGWDELESLMGVTLPRDPVNTGGSAYQNGKTYTYYAGHLYATNTGCFPGQWYLLMWHVESYTVNSSDRGGGVKKCNGAGTFIFSSPGYNASKGTGVSSG